MSASMYNPTISYSKRLHHVAVHASLLTSPPRPPYHPLPQTLIPCGGCVQGNRELIDSMAGGSAKVLTQVLKLIDNHDLYGSVAYPKRHTQKDISDIYRLSLATHGVFTNVALQEPFGLTVIEVRPTPNCPLILLSLFITPLLPFVFPKPAPAVLFLPRPPPLRPPSRTSLFLCHSHSCCLCLSFAFCAMLLGCIFVHCLKLGSHKVRCK